MDSYLISEILELNELAKINVPSVKRFDYNKIFRNRFSAIIGPKGSGKTVMLRQALKETNNSLYISLDSLAIDDLFSIVKYFYEERNIKHFFLDEIHYYQNWAKDLKKIYDFLNVKITLTSSLSLNLYKNSYDLGRRLKIINLFPFSLREYLFFKGTSIKKIKLEDILKGNVSHLLNFDYLFSNYMSGALYPLMLSENDNSIFNQILNSIIERDIAIAYNLPYSEISTIKDIVKFIYKSRAESISYSSIAKNLKITKYKSIKYVNALVDSFVLMKVDPIGTNITKEPKILLMPPYRSLFSNDQGALREEFFILSMMIANITPYYLKSKIGRKMPDYYIKEVNTIFEIGGLSKSNEQFKGFNKFKKIILTYPGSLKKGTAPLISVGFLY